MTDKRAETLVPIHDLLARRWSGHAFDAEKPVKRAQLVAMLEAARWAPSCAGEEPWRYIVWDRANNELGWQRAFDCLSTGSQLWAVTAPLIILSLAATKSYLNGKANRWAQHDTGAASENLCLQAAAMGLYAHQIGDFDGRRVKRIFSVPKEFEPMAMMAVGHPGSARGLDTQLRDRELGARYRSPINERFFENQWGEPVQM